MLRETRKLLDSYSPTGLILKSYLHSLQTSPLRLIPETISEDAKNLFPELYVQTKNSIEQKIVDEFTQLTKQKNNYFLQSKSAKEALDLAVVYTSPFVEQAKSMYELTPERSYKNHLSKLVIGAAIIGASFAIISNRYVAYTKKEDLIHKQQKRESAVDIVELYKTYKK